jgi:hypothetical protein
MLSGEPEPFCDVANIMSGDFVPIGQHTVCTPL